MKQFMYILAFVLFLMSACKSKDIAGTSGEDKGQPSTTQVQVKSPEELKEGETVVEEPRKKAMAFSIDVLNKPDKADLLFSIKGISLAEGNVKVDVQYGGGCVRPHEFDLLTDGIIDANGNMKFQLLHRTHNDLCKALIMETLVFDFSRLYDLNSEKLKTFTINEQRKVEF